MTRLRSLERALGQLFTPARRATRAPSATRIVPSAAAYHWQVYTTANGSRFRNAPAYQGNRRDEAERIARLVGGTIERAEFPCSREVYAVGCAPGDAFKP